MSSEAEAGWSPRHSTQQSPAWCRMSASRALWPLPLRLLLQVEGRTVTAATSLNFSVLVCEVGFTMGRTPKVQGGLKQVDTHTALRTAPGPGELSENSSIS